MNCFKTKLTLVQLHRKSKNNKILKKQKISPTDKAEIKRKKKN